VPDDEKDESEKNGKDENVKNRGDSDGKEGENKSKL
jgi:hypothetical protein